MNIIEQHPAVFAIVAYWMFSAFVGGMPAPEETDGRKYRWAHDSLHILAGNLTSAIAQRYPQLPAGTTKETVTAEMVTVPDNPTQLQETQS